MCAERRHIQPATDRQTDAVLLCSQRQSLVALNSVQKSRVWKYGHLWTWSIPLSKMAQSVFSSAVSQFRPEVKMFRSVLYFPHIHCEKTANKQWKLGVVNCLIMFQNARKMHHSEAKYPKNLWGGGTAPSPDPLAGFNGYGLWTCVVCIYNKTEKGLPAVILILLWRMELVGASPSDLLHQGLCSWIQSFNTANRKVVGGSIPQLIDTIPLLLLWSQEAFFSV